MDIEIDIDDDTPIFSQLVNQVKERVITGDLVAGFSLPSIRQLANELGVNQNTVAKAYKVLERDSIIVARGYRGTFIHENAKENCQVNITAIHVPFFFSLRPPSVLLLHFIIIIII